MEKKYDSKLESFNKSLYIFLIAVTITIFPKFQDPFNTPKQIILFLGIGYLISVSYRELTFQLKDLDKKIYVPMFLLILFLFISALKTQDKYVGFFGEELRRNGFLTYLCLIVLAFVIYFKMDVSKLRLFFRTNLLIASLTSVYGLLQHFNLDPVAWNNPYNSIISTLGNPNFASALFSIQACIIIVTLFDSSVTKIVKVYSSTIIAIQIFDIFASQSRQGIVSIFFSLGLCFFILIFRSSRKLSLLYLIFYISIITLAVLGMLQKGPFSQFLYKESVSVRGFYWRAAIRMFKDNLVFGVGVDSYGFYFKEFRDSQYPIRYGYNITSSNAHSVPLQFFATSGVFVGLTYLFIVFLAFIYTIKSFLNRANSDFSIDKLAIFSGWLAYQATSVISIDQIGLASWGWFTLGLLFAFSRYEKLKDNLKVDKSISGFHSKRMSKNNLLDVLTPKLIIVALLIFPVSQIVRGELMSFEIRAIGGALSTNQTGSSDSIALKDLLSRKIVNFYEIPLQPPYYDFQSANLQIALGGDAKNQGINILRKLLRQNPRNLDYLSAFAYYSESSGDFSSAQVARVQIAKLDPFNINNLFLLGQIYKLKNEKSQMIETLNRIRSLNPTSEVTKQAEQVLKF